MVGGCGSVGSTVALGVAALEKGLTDSTGMVTALPPFAGADLPDPAGFEIGGHEIRSETLLEAARASHQDANLFDTTIVDSCAPRLKTMQRNIRPGTIYGVGKTIAALADRPGLPDDTSAGVAIERLAADIVEFRKRKRLDHVVVMHVASSEPPPSRAGVAGNYAKLAARLGRKQRDTLPTSTVYALAAIEAGCPYVNFTPSIGINVPAVRERAEQKGIPYMGSDGKTGESLVKSFLAPMFMMRNLSVLSWVGQNILGNRDGQVLADPRTRAVKIQSKDKVLHHLRDTKATTRVSIDYVPSLVDWKVAWDFIHFEGFLNTKMNMQFTWQGSDSALAAPLVIDLTRLAVREARAGRGGPMQHLACFFKDPLDVDEAGYAEQWRRLIDHLELNGQP